MKKNTKKILNIIALVVGIIGILVAIYGLLRSLSIV